MLVAISIVDALPTLAEGVDVETRSPLSGVPEMQWLDPWWSTEDQDIAFHDAFVRQLTREVPPGHVMHGLPVKLLARGEGDDALFLILDGSERVAVVHLTWCQTPERLPWPITEVYEIIERFVADRMIPEHQERLGS